MSAETLRKAAALMRERAEAANAFLDELTETITFQIPASTDLRLGNHYWQWHPAVALAVADLLDRAADDHDETPCPAIDGARAVARAYLGEAS